MASLPEIPVDIAEHPFYPAQGTELLFADVLHTLQEVSASVVALAILGSFASGGLELKKIARPSGKFPQDLDMMTIHGTRLTAKKIDALDEFSTTYFVSMSATKRRALVPFLSDISRSSLDFCPIFRPGKKYAVVSKDVARLLQEFGPVSSPQTLPGMIASRLLEMLSPKYPANVTQLEANAACEYLYEMSKQNRILWQEVIETMRKIYLFKKGLKHRHLFVARQFRSSISEVKTTEEFLNQVNVQRSQVLFEFLLKTSHTSLADLSLLYPTSFLEKLNSSSLTLKTV